MVWAAFREDSKGGLPGSEPVGDITWAVVGIFGRWFYIKRIYITIGRMFFVFCRGLKQMEGAILHQTFST